MPQLFSKWRNKRLWLVPIGIAVLSYFTITTWFQIKYWTNSITLYERAINVAYDNHVAHNKLGNTYQEQGEITKAIEHYSAALRAKPDYETGYRNMGNALAAQGKFKEAVDHYYEALRIKSEFDAANINLEKALALKKTPK